MSLNGKVIAITGAASGIGLATAKQAAAKGASLSLADVAVDLLSQAVEELKAQGVNVIGRKVNIASSKEVDDWIAETVEHFGHLDGAANVAAMEAMPGLKQRFNEIVDTTDEMWDYVSGINFTGTFYCLRAQLRAISEGGSIVNVSSATAMTGKPGLGAYAAGKSGIIGLTKTAAREAGERGIRVNTVCPGSVVTPMLKRLINGGATPAVVNGKKTKSFEDSPQLGRSAEPIEIGQSICYLLSDEASYITATTVPVDGGVVC